MAQKFLLGVINHILLGSFFNLPWLSYDFDGDGWLQKLSALQDYDEFLPNFDDLRFEELHSADLTPFSARLFDDLRFEEELHSEDLAPFSVHLF